MTDFSHLHALEERAVNIQRSMMVAKKDVKWRSLAVEITQEEIDAVPSGDPGQWEISMRELCQEIEKLPASEQQTAISVKASAIYQSLGEFNRYCESFFDAAVSEKLCNFMNTHAFQPGDSEHGWEKQCSVIAPDGLRHCGGYREDHPMSVKAEGK